jgi:hypothetical protein
MENTSPPILKLHAKNIKCHFVKNSDRLDSIIAINILRQFLNAKKLI